MATLSTHGGPDDSLDTPQARAGDLRAGIERRLTSLESYSVQQLASCSGPSELHAELVEGIRQDAQVVDSQLEELALLAEEAPSEQIRTSILQASEFLSARLSRVRVQAREAAVRSKRRIEINTASSQRDALLGPVRNSSRGPGPESTSGTSKDDELMNATANVTDGLRRTRQLLEQELERSGLSTQMLERSSQTLNLTSDQYTSFSGLLNASKTLITTMQKADTLDRLLILAALLFFGLVCVLIVKRRIIDRGIRAATLFSKIAGVGNGASFRSAVAVESLTSASSAVKAVITDFSQTGSRSPPTSQSVLASVMSVASLASASLAGVAVSPPLHTTPLSLTMAGSATVPQDRPQTTQGDSHSQFHLTSASLLLPSPSSDCEPSTPASLATISDDIKMATAQSRPEVPPDQTANGHVVDEL